ncbi:MAG: GNAT family acetyltransferase [Polaromonas sp.]
MNIRPFGIADTEAVVALWQACELVRPWNDPYKDILRKLSVNAELFLLGEVQGTRGNELVAGAMFGYEGHRGWLNYLAVAPAWRRKGFAAQLMVRGEHLLLLCGCPKINLLVRSGNAEALAMYEKLGYTPDHSVSLGKRLIPDTPLPFKEP